MNNVNNFSFQRLWQLIIYETKIERKRILSILKTVTIVTALPFIYYLVFDGESNYNIYARYCIDMLNSYQITAVTVLMCQIFNIMHGKECAIQYHLLPANRLEKLLSQLLLYTVGIALIICISYLIIECIHYPLVCVLGKSEEFRQSIAPIFFHFLPNAPQSSEATQAAIVITLYAITIYSIFINLRCRGFNWLVGYLLTLILFIASFFAFIEFFIEKYFIVTVIIDAETTETVTKTATVPFIISSALLIATIILLWRDSYKKFGRLTIA